MSVDGKGAVEMHVDVTSDRDALRLVKDLHQPRAAIYWIDLTLTAVLGWCAFGLALMARPFSAGMWLAMVLAAFVFYRGLCFVHEISHLRRRSLPGFEAIWNLAFGIPLLIPSFAYVGVHSSHHSLATYGTDQDPEYLPFGGSHRMTVLFLLQSILIPLALLFRFLLLAPVALLWPRFHGWLVAHASSLSLNSAYRRQNTPALTARIKYGEITILLVWTAGLAAAWRHDLVWKGIAVWYGINAFTSVCNSLRTLGAHRYESIGMPLDRAGQLADSIDTPGAAWTELWAPVGLRYHALHHYFPGVPYHNLGLAYRRLMSALPKGTRYREATSPSLPKSLRHLYAAGETSFHKKRTAGVYPRQPLPSHRK
jgi:fatty acid desaturase